MSRKSAFQLQWMVLLACLPAMAPAAEEAPVDELEVAEITGTRIARPAADSPNPIMSVDAENIALSGRTNLTDLLSQMPALVSSTTSYDSAGTQAAGFGDAGINFLNLRNLGTGRTLVLVNGRRHVAGMPGLASVDINTIPRELVDRIDVLTGGVSAIYGADGVSGVVNFVMKRNFEGLVVTGQRGVSGHGDADNQFLSLTAGKNFFDNRGNVAVSYTYNADKRVSLFDRARTGDPLRTYGLVRNPDDDPDDPDVYDRVFMNNLSYADSSRDGAFDTDWDLAPDFTGSGTVYDRGTILPSTGGLAQGGSNTPQAGYSGDLQPEIKRHSLNLFSHLELTDRMRLFGEAKYVRTDNFTLRQPTFDFYSFISAENPLIPSVIRSSIVPGAAADAFGLPDGILMTRDNFDLGPRGDKNRRETVRTVLGMDGALSGNSRYEISYTHGETTAHFSELNQRIADRYWAALDAVDEGLYLHGVANGNIRCRIDLDPPGADIDPINAAIGNYSGGPPVTFTPGASSGCAPLNLFGEYVASDAAREFAIADVRNHSKVSHDVVSGSINGDFGDAFALPGGKTGYAAGAEYRREKSSSVPDQLIQNGQLLGYATILPESGSFNVKELFAEINLPVLKEARFAHALSFGAAARWSDYSTVGNTLTWKLDARYAPVRDIMFLGTWSEAVRAPNITELYAPTSSGFLFVNDPCDAQFIGDGSQYRAANCLAMLTQLGIDPDDFEPADNNDTNIEGTATGNPLLREEKARTWTLGFLLRPAALPGLAVRFDWYDIKLKNAINTATAEEFAQLCVDQPSLGNAYCDAITRDEDTGFVNGWMIRPENVAKFTTAGADLTVDYQFAPSRLGDFRLALKGGYLDELQFIATPGADIDSNRGEQSAPKYQATADLTWNLDRWTANYGINYFSKTRRFTTQELQANPDLTDPRYFFYKAKVEHDVQVGFRPQDSSLNLYVGVNNLFDAQPSLGAKNYPVSFVGRYFYGGVRMKLY